MQFEVEKIQLDKSHEYHFFENGVDSKVINYLMLISQAILSVAINIFFWY